ncbi:hypothetical protein PQQ51_23015 [Paraburkholderia xenovorans]|uniref:hypothetical protein n=1 Tax=Paraburkholderia xenovorans TaxID=36873 RepID=UPI0038BCDC8F
MAIVTIMNVSDDVISDCLKLNAWTPITGSLLVCGLSPYSSDGPIDEARCKELSRGMHQYAKPLRIAALWRSQISAGELVRPHDFLSWCKYRNIHEIDGFLERVRVAAPWFKPERILASGNLQRTATVRDIGDRSWGVPTIPDASEPSQSAPSGISAVPNQPGGRGIQQKKTGGKSDHALAALIEQAQNDTSPPKSVRLVYDTLVEYANRDEPPSPIEAFVPGRGNESGIKYRIGSEHRYFSLGALRSYYYRQGLDVKTSLPAEKRDSEISTGRPFASA